LGIVKTMIWLIWTTGILLGGDGSPNLPSGIKLYVLDGGTIDVSDMRSFSSDGRFDGEQIQLANPAFLIRHPKGDLLWDTGHADALAGQPDGTRFEEWHNRLKTPLAGQLAQLGLASNDIEYLALSHLHPDHSGNANRFAGSIFIVNELERRHMFSKDVKANFGSAYNALEDSKTLVFQFEHDVFGDGTVVIYHMPGHTPGSCALLVRLAKTGNVLLSGDLYIHARARQQQTVPRFTHDQAALLESRRKFEALAKSEKALVVIQHSKPDFEKLPKFPAYLD